MTSRQIFADKAAVGISALCVVHCLTMPLIVVLLPALSGTFVAEESFHLMLVFVVLPLSMYALTLGCKKHQRYHVLAIGGIGLAILVFAAIFGHDFLGEFWEKALTVIGASVVAIGHIWNYRLCKTASC